MSSIFERNVMLCFQLRAHCRDSFPDDNTHIKKNVSVLVTKIIWSYKEKSSDFQSEVEQNTSLSENQRSLPNSEAAQMLEHTLLSSAGLDIVDLRREI